MTDILHDKQGLAAANMLNRAQMTLLTGAGIPHSQQIRESHVRWALTPVDSPIFNAAIVMSNAATPDDVLPRLRGVTVPVAIWLHEANPLVETLLAEGLTDSGTAPAMGIDLHAMPAVPATDLQIEIVRDETMMADYLAVLLAAFALEAFAEPALQGFGGAGYRQDAPMQHYVGYVEGRAVATSALLHGQVAGIYNVATADGYRGRGYGSAISRFALDQGVEHGYTFGILQSSKVGHSVYRKMGFEDTFHYRVLVWQPSS